jgi:hypothetical protein
MLGPSRRPRSADRRRGSSTDLLEALDRSRLGAAGVEGAHDVIE